MITTIWGATRKPVSSQRLADFFGRFSEDLHGTLYIGYPVIGTPEGAYPIDALWLCPERGIVFFNLVEGREVVDYQEHQDDAANKLEAKLRNHKSLMNGRKLKISITPITFAPLVNPSLLSSVDPFLANDDTLESCINSIPSEDQAYEQALSVIQSISTIRKGRKKRDIKIQNSKGYKLKQLEDSIANLDNLQGRAVIETVQGVQRIRGLAGSGKTIVLALKAAYLHAQHPEWKIAVTFHTRALKGQIRRLINTFYIEQTNEEPDWDNLHIINSWGAPGLPERNGIYYTYCKHTGAEYYDLQGAKAKFPNGKELEEICKLALDYGAKIEPIYDAILVDEAQDLSSSFLKICYELLTQDKRLVYAYDELQSLGGSSLPSPEDIFGYKEDGQALVKFYPAEDGKPTQDLILEKCYRNSRPVLATAHALGFGVYRTPPFGSTTGLIQMFDQSSLWLDVGYTVKEGDLSDGKQVRLARTSQSSPSFLEIDDIDSLITFREFSSDFEQAQYVASQIEVNLKSDELQPDDIIVINPDPLKTRSAVGPIRKILFEREIKTHLAGVDTSPDVFFDEEGKSIAFTGIFRAKGNEAGMVYIINAQDCFSSLNSLARIRNQLFTAITRSKAWVQVLGVGPSMNKLKDEFEKIKQENFELAFKYPTHEERKQLNIVNRDKDARVIKDGSSRLNKLVSDLKAGRVFIEDLPKDQVEYLKGLLGGEDN